MKSTLSLSKEPVLAWRNWISLQITKISNKQNFKFSTKVTNYVGNKLFKAEQVINFWHEEHEFSKFVRRKRDFVQNIDFVKNFEGLILKIAEKDEFLVIKFQIQRNLLKTGDHCASENESSLCQTKQTSSLANIKISHIR